jgi:hypothetical protein
MLLGTSFAILSTFPSVVGLGVVELVGFPPHAARTIAATMTSTGFLIRPPPLLGF